MKTDPSEPENQPGLHLYFAPGWERGGPALGGCDSPVYLAHGLYEGRFGPLENLQ